MAEYSPDADRLAIVFGGSGFVGRHIVRALARDGWRIRVAVRRPDLAGFLRPLGVVGQIEPVQANLRYPEFDRRGARRRRRRRQRRRDPAPERPPDLRGGACRRRRRDRARRGRRRDRDVHPRVRRRRRRALAQRLYRQQGPRRERGARRVAERGHPASIGRSSVPRTIFSTASARWRAPCRRCRCSAAARPSCSRCSSATSRRRRSPSIGDADAAGRAYELGGPEILTLREVAALALRIVERRRALVPLPFALARLLAWSTEVASTLSLGAFPAALTTTRDQVELLRHDNVVSAAAIAEGRTLRELGVSPQGIEAVAPSYLYRFRKTGQYAARRLA